MKISYLVQIFGHDIYFQMHVEKSSSVMPGMFLQFKLLDYKTTGYVDRSVTVYIRVENYRYNVKVATCWVFL